MRGALSGYFGPKLWLAGFGLVVASASGADVVLSYREIIQATEPPSLSARLEAKDAISGSVTLTGGDARRPRTPFQIDWGDGRSSHSFFPASHTYAAPARNYLITVRAQYADGSAGSTNVPVRFAPMPIVLGPWSVPAELAVTLPGSVPPIRSTLAGRNAPEVKPFPGSIATSERRAVLERVMGAYATIQRDLVNDDLVKPGGSFAQIVMTPVDTTRPYAFSVWYTDPVMFVGQLRLLGEETDWSSIAHEMGHNFTLNSPAAWRLGGKIDGPANAIVSETLAQIFQHVTCYLLVNEARDYGVPPLLAEEIARSAHGSFARLKRESGPPFRSWNEPLTPVDETLPTFMTIAYEFFAAGDVDGKDYRLATKRLMFFLQRFNADWQKRFSARVNSTEAEAFRAALMVAAVSYGVAADRRERFRALGFPIDDAVFEELTRTVTEAERKSAGASPI